MTKPYSEYTVYLLQILALLGDIRVKRMFDGYAVFPRDNEEELIFALIVDQQLYVEVGDLNRQNYISDSID